MGGGGGIEARWERLAELIRGQIDAGEFVPGDRLPTMAQLTEQHEIAQSVVRQAFVALQSEGYVKGVRGVGVFVADR